ncbi:MAG: tRNA (adenosine(37)-N6)-dimethylallyltransferase MiaA [Bacteroidales bacterium]|nr:tRNA (adenosine(37)-N6)-dimethylallyltransferase MiaA [Bacteroidales bacterium]
MPRPCWSSDKTPHVDYSRKHLIIIAGPTAVGKTAYAIRTALEHRTEIISCDSRQMYREMRIGTAVPSPGELAAVPHHFIGNLSVSDYYNASRFETDALQLLDDLFTRHDTVVMCGGSGLYIQALWHGMDEFPEIDPEVRRQVLGILAQEGLPRLRRELKLADPAYYARVDLRNTQRIVRAVETFRQTGRPYSSFLTEHRQIRPFKITGLVLNRPRAILYDRIDRRVDVMMADGLQEEARQLYPYRHLNALQTVGYKELFDYFDGKCTLEQAVTNIKCHTRRYAKRQLSWFARDPEWEWIEME